MSHIIEVMLKVCGSNIPSRLGEKSNNKDDGGNPAINPPVNSNLKVSLISSYSSYGGQAIVITTNGEIFAAGSNTNKEIIGSLPEQDLTVFTKFEIKDSKGCLFYPISAVCCWRFTVYIVSSKNGFNNLLAFSYSGIKTASPLFLNIGNSNPVSLYGSIYYAAAIDDEGSIIIIPSYEILENSPSQQIESNPLPNNDKAVSVAFCQNFIFALGISGSVYMSEIEETENKLNFSLVNDLKNNKIIEISGTSWHCFAVSEDGLVFGIGNNSVGQLCFGQQNMKIINKFKLISSLSNYKIKHASAGYNHSLFKTEDGKILECGSTYYGQLISCKPGPNAVFCPKETGIEEKDAFCIACNCTTAVFIGHDPLRSPNRRVTHKSIFQLEAENKQLRSIIAKLDKKVKKLTQQQQKQIHKFELLDLNEFNKLKQTEEIGHGAQSKVIKVIREEEFALKIIELKNKKNLISNVRNLLKEYEHINLLNHPNIIRTFGFYNGDEENPPSILLEFCPKCLSDIVEEMTDFERICSIFEISLGMAAVHEANIIHRDLKPSNIMFGKDGHVRVCDFGVSCISSVENQTNSMTKGVGTLKFMAPELLNESSKYTNKVDVYSFGVVVFYILTKGKLPEISIIDIGNGKKAPIPKGINKISSTIINKCWTTKADDRPSFIQIINFIKSNDFKLIDGIEKEIYEIKKFLSI